MDNSPAIAFMKDDQGRYVYVNKPFEDLFQQKLQLLRGGTSFDWLPLTLPADPRTRLAGPLTGEPGGRKLCPRKTARRITAGVQVSITDVAGRGLLAVLVSTSLNGGAPKRLCASGPSRRDDHRFLRLCAVPWIAPGSSRRSSRIGIRLNVDRCPLHEGRRAKHAMNVANTMPTELSRRQRFDLADLKGLPRRCLRTACWYSMTHRMTNG